MKALTLHQPYASAIALGFKQVETRSWRTYHRGPVAIHAAGIAHLAYRPVFEKCAERAAFTAAGYRDFFNLPQGVIVAIAHLEICQATEERAPWLSAAERYWGDYRDCRFCWTLTNIRRLATPIRTRGMQGLWNWTPPADLKFVSDAPATVLPPTVNRLPVLPAYRLPAQIQRPPFSTA